MNRQIKLDLTKTKINNDSLIRTDKVLIFEPRHEKTNILVSDLTRHKPGCIATEDG